jgi:hypothetical protein
MIKRSFWALALLFVACAHQENAQANKEAQGVCLEACEAEFLPCRNECGAQAEAENCFERCEESRATCVSACMAPDKKWR